MSPQEILLDRIAKLMGSAEFLVVLNGIPKRYQNHWVYAKVQRDPSKSDKVIFYIKYKNDGKLYHNVPTNLEQTVLADSFSSNLYGFDFSSWTEGKNLVGNVSINNGLRLLFIETPMYTIFKENIPKRDNLNVRFQPTVMGKELNTLELSYLLDQFRINGFLGLLELERIGITKRVSFRVPRFYKGPEGFFLASVRESNIFNPFFDDNMIYSTIKERSLIKEIQTRSVFNEQIGTYVTYLSHYQASRYLGLNSLVPFDYRIFTSILAGLVVDADALPTMLPHKGKSIMRLAVSTDEFPLTITEEEYRESSPYKREHYVRSTTFNTFLMHNFEFFRRKGFTDLNKLLEVMADAVLL